MQKKVEARRKAKPLVKAAPRRLAGALVPAAGKRIHPSAIIESGAKIGSGVEIGPFCHVGPDVVLGDDVRLLSHVVIAGRTTIGARTRVFPFASLGHEPQDLKFKGEATTLDIGVDCTIREGVTMNPGTAGGGFVTRVGDRCTFMANTHVAHDCHVGDNVIFSNGAGIAGHCRVGDFVIISGGVGVHQFVRIGHHAFIGGLAALENDVIPFGMAIGNRAWLAGLNIIGMKRLQFSREKIHNLRQAYRLLFSNEGTLAERLADVEADEIAQDPSVREILDFIKAQSDRSLCLPRTGP